jgi:hypothetical protein
LGGVLSGWLFLNVYRLKRINRRFWVCLGPRKSTW